MALSVEQILLRVLADTDDAEEDLGQLAAELNAFDQQEAEAELRLEDRQVNRVLRSAHARLAAFADTVASAEAEVDTASAHLQLTALERALGAVDREEVEPSVRVQIARALAEIGVVRAALAKLDATDVDIDVDVRRGVVERFGMLATQVGLLAGQFTSADDSGGGLLSRLGGLSVSMGPLRGSIATMATAFLTLLPILVAVTGALVALIGSLGAATLALGAMAVAAASLFAPAIVLGIGVIGRFKDTVEDAGSAAHRLKEVADDVGRVFKNVLAPAADAVMRGISGGLRSVLPMLRELRPAFTAFGNAVGAAFRRVLEQFSSPEWGRFFSFLLRSASRVAPILADSFVAFAEILREIARAAMPFFIGGLRSMRDWLRNVADAAGEGGLSGTISGLVDHLRSWLNLIRALGGMFMALFSAAAGPGRELVDWLAEGADRIADWIKSAEGTEKISQFFADTMPLVRELVSVLGKLFVAFVQLGQVLAPVLTPIVRLFGQLVDIVNFLLGLMLRIPAPVRAVVGQFLAFAAGLGKIRALSLVARAALAGLITLLNTLGGIAVDSFEAVRDGAVGAGKATAKGLKAIWGGIRDVARTMWGALRGLARTMWGGIKDAVLSPIQAARASLRSIWQAVRDAARSAWQSVRDAARNLWSAIRDAILNPARNARESLRNIWSAARDAARAIWQSIRDAARNIWSAVKDAITGPARNAKEGAVAAFRALRDGAVAAWQSARSGAQSVWSSIRQAITNAARSALEGVKNLGGAFYNAGKALIEAVANGIRAAAGAAISAAKAVADRVKSILPGSEPKDPTSPLRGLGKSGEAIVANIAAGIRGAASAIPDALAVSVGDVPALANVAPAVAPSGGEVHEHYYLPETRAGGASDVRTVAAQLQLLRRQRRR